MDEGIKTISLSSLIKQFESNKVSLDKLRETLFTFKCCKNKEEEDFLHNDAIFFEQRNKARTFLLERNNQIVGYYSLAFKSINLEAVSLSKRKDMTAGEAQSETYSAYLIGHIAKADGVYEKLGYYMLDSARDLIYEAQKYVGGRLIYIDCKDEEKLIRFYEDYGFKYFNTSPKTKLKQLYMKI